MLNFIFMLAYIYIFIYNIINAPFLLYINTLDNVLIFNFNITCLENSDGGFFLSSDFISPTFYFGWYILVFGMLISMLIVIFFRFIPWTKHRSSKTRWTFFKLFSVCLAFFLFGYFLEALSCFIDFLFCMLFYGGWEFCCLFFPSCADSFLISHDCVANLLGFDYLWSKPIYYEFVRDLVYQCSLPKVNLTLVPEGMDKMTEIFEFKANLGIDDGVHLPASQGARNCFWHTE